MSTIVRRCPTCQRGTSKVGNAAFPFCSARCRAIDLGRWLNEEYRIPVEGDGAAETAITDSDDER